MGIRSGRLAAALAAAVLCAGLWAAVLVQGEVTRQTAATVDANWRGVYDILVTPTGQDFGGQDTAGLVDGNFVATGGSTGISDGTLAKIRQLPGVEVAAPIGMVGVLRQLNLVPQVFVTDDAKTGQSVLAGGPNLYRITSTLTRQTGLGPSVVVSRSAGVVGLRPLRPGDVANPNPADPAMGSSVGGFGPQSSELGFQLPLGALPAFATSVIAVDPVAEQKFLQGHGDFLAPLSTLHHRTAGEFSTNGEVTPVLAPGARYATQEAAIETAQTDPGLANTPLVPLVVNTAANGQATLTVTIEKGTKAPKVIPTAEDTWKHLIASTRFAPFTTLTRDLSTATVPFSSPDLTLMWPHSKWPPGNDPGLFSAVSTSLQPALIGRPAYLAADDSNQTAPKFTVTPQQVVGPDGLPQGSIDPAFGTDSKAGSARAYRALTQTGGTGFAAALPAPLGTFATSDLAMPFNRTSYVPLGAYDANITTAVPTAADANNGRTTGTPVLPSLSGLDFITSPPGAFTDLAGGKALRGTTPIDAIRVRLSGISGYTPGAVAKVDAAAKAIASLGVRATVVAGSSPQPVAVYVPKYYPGKNGPSADLGWVRQDWTTLGAATTVVTARSALTSWLLGLGIGVSSIALICAAVLSGRLRRIEVAVLRDVGWTEARIRRRLTRAQLAPVIAVVIAACLAVILARDRSLAGWAAGGGALAAIAAGISAVLVAGTRESTDRRPTTGRRIVASDISLVWRQAHAAPWTTIIKVLGPAVTGVAGAAILAAILNSRRNSGTTRLAAVVDATTFVGTITLGAVGMLAAVLITAVGTRSDQRHRGAQWNTLRVIGFRDSRIARIKRVDVAATTILATVIALGASIVVVTATNISPVGVALGAIITAATAAISGVLSTRADSQ